MSARKFNTNAMSALGLARALAEISNKTFYFNGTVTAGANGNANVAHGLGAAPTFFAAGITGDTVNSCDVESVTATNVVVRIKNASGADVTSGTHDIWVMASTEL